LSSVLVGQVSPLVCVLVIVLRGLSWAWYRPCFVPFGVLTPPFLLNILRRSSPALSRKKMGIVTPFLGKLFSI